MVEFTTTVGFEEGLHARPAAELVRVCQKALADIKIIKDDLEINPKSILGILTLGAAHGDKIRILVDGADENDVAKNLKAFFNK